VLQPTPFKKNLVLRFEERIKKGENHDFTSEIRNYIGDYTTSKANHSATRDNTTKNKLIQLTTSVEIDEEVDNGKVEGK
jgi:hypothetical protein